MQKVAVFVIVSCTGLQQAEKTFLQYKVTNLNIGEPDKITVRSDAFWTSLVSDCCNSFILQAGLVMKRIFRFSKKLGLWLLAQNTIFLYNIQYK